MRLVSYVLLCFMFKQSSRACSFIKKNRLWHRCFPVNFAKLLKAPFRTEHLRWLLLCVEVKLFSNPYCKKYNNPQINFSDFVCHISFPNSGYLMFYIRPIRYSFFHWTLRFFIDNESEILQIYRNLHNAEKASPFPGILWNNCSEKFRKSCMKITVR